MRITPSAALAAPGLSLFVEPPPRTAGVEVLQLLHRALPGHGWLLDEEAPQMHPPLSPDDDRPEVRLMAASGRCECAFETVRSASTGQLSFVAPLGHGATSAYAEGGRRLIPLSDQRVLLRIVAPEEAQPGLNWALGVEALRVLECTPSRHAIDWLVSVDEEEVDDVVEKIQCGVQGESYRRHGTGQPLAVQRVCCGGGSALVLPECCRVAAATDGALPADVEVLWRVSAESGSLARADGRSGGRQLGSLERSLERCFAQRPYWVQAPRASDAAFIGRSLPPGSVWAAHLTRRDAPLPTRDEIGRLRQAGCGGVGLAWGDALERALRPAASAAGAETAELETPLGEWAARAGLSDPR